LNEYGAVRNYRPCGLQIANVGVGRINIFCQEGLDTYNWIAGILIAKEAGATILNKNGEDWQWGDNSLLVGYSPVLLGLVNTLGV
jgi:myo-inositol-1(or 4)-monophosphatase